MCGNENRERTGDACLSPLFVLLVCLKLVVNRTSNNVKQLACNSLLTTLVVLQIQFTQEFVSIVGSRLHCNHTCGMLGSDGVEQCGVEHQMGEFRYEFIHHGVEIRLNNEVVVQRLTVQLSLVVCLFLVPLTQILNCLTGGDIRLQVALLIGSKFAFDPALLK